MMDSAQDEAVLDLVAPELEGQGYKVVRQPSPAFLPSFLRQFRPDAIAIGRLPKLVIEIARSSNSAPGRAKRLEEAVRGQLDWQLRIVLDRSDERSILLAPTKEYIDETLGRMQALMGGQEGAAALLLGWATLEGVGRRLEPTQFSKPQTPGRAIEVLASLGYLVPDDAALLRGLAEHRNRFIHGQLDEQVEGDSLVRFAGILEELASLDVEPALT